MASGAGAAALACLDLIVSLGLPRHNVFVCDSSGVIHSGRKGPMDPNKARYAQDTSARKLEEVMAGADIFLGLSAAGALKSQAGLCRRPLKNKAKRPAQSSAVTVSLGLSPQGASPYPC